MISEDKINRFVDAFNKSNSNPNLAIFLSEILDDIENLINYASTLEMDVFGLDSHNRNFINLLVEGKELKKKSNRWLKQIRYANKKAKNS